MHRLHMLLRENDNIYLYVNFSSQSLATPTRKKKPKRTHMQHLCVSVDLEHPHLMQTEHFSNSVHTLWILISLFDFPISTNTETFFWFLSILNMK